uniref:Fibroblast growth factor receptor substrate 2b n=1 Tax=Neogobius melanostomus TaxID=47308 RepID=A0A8C6T4H3_9GOBI
MGGCLSCPEKETIPDNHHSKFKVINVDDDGNELGSGVMELTEAELVLHTHRRDDVRWPYLCLRRYGYDSNLFSFESGRRCQTGQGIFAFKCARAEEIFNLLQEVMHNHSISVVEEAVLEPGQQGAPHSNTPAALGYSVPSVPNGVSRLPSVGDAPSHPSTRHPSVASTRLPSVGEESTHPLLLSDDQVHTYVNTAGLEEQPSPLTVTTPLESPPTSPLAPPTPPPPRAPPPPVAAPPSPAAVPPPAVAPPSEPVVTLDGASVRFVLGPTPVQRQRQKDQSETSKGEEAVPQSNGSAPPARRQRPPPLTPDPNVNNSAQRRTALLDYENLPSLPPVWEARPREDEPQTPLGLNGFSCAPQSALYSAAPLSALSNSAHLYVNTENVTAPLSAHIPLRSRRAADSPSVFTFDNIRRPLEEQTLNYVEVETDTNHSPSTPRTPTSPAPATPTRRTDQYAIIDHRCMAAMSSLQKARPKDDGTSRKTRHNSTELPTKTTA